MTDGKPDRTPGSGDAATAGASTGGDDGRNENSRKDRPWTPSILTAIRTRRRWRGSALLVATAAGLGLAWLHWVGLFVAGALVGVVSRTPGRAVLAGGVLGASGIVLQVLLAPAMDLAGFLSLRPPVYVTLGVGIGAPVWGSLIRGVV